MAVKIITPISMRDPIVDENKCITPYFQRLLQDISDARISASLVEALGGDPNADRVVVWDDSAGTLSFMTTSEVLDFIGAGNHGDVLYRDSTGWARLAPGTSGDVLTTHGIGADPTWETPSGSSTPWWWSPPLSSAFTLISGDATNLTLSDDADIGLVLDFNSNSVAGEISRAAVETITSPSAAWNYQVRMTGTVYSNNSCWAGLIVRNVANNRNLILMLVNDHTILIQRRTMTAFSATANTVASAVIHSQSTFSNLFWKVAFDGTNTVSFHTSADGKWWRQIYSETVATYLTANPDRIGFCLGTSGTAGLTSDLNLSVQRRIKSW